MGSLGSGIDLVAAGIKENIRAMQKEEAERIKEEQARIKKEQKEAEAIQKAEARKIKEEERAKKNWEKFNSERELKLKVDELETSVETLKNEIEHIDLLIHKFGVNIQDLRTEIGNIKAHTNMPGTKIDSWAQMRMRPGPLNYDPEPMHTINDYLNETEDILNSGEWEVHHLI